MSAMRLFNKRKNPDGSNTFIVDTHCTACGNETTVPLAGWSRLRCENCGQWRDRGAYYGSRKNKLPFTVVLNVDEPDIQQIVEVLAADPRDALEEAVEKVLMSRPDMDVDRLGKAAYPASDYQYMVFRGFSYADGEHEFDIVKMPLAEELARI